MADALGHDRNEGLRRDGSRRADAMVKAAKVELIGFEKIGGGYVTARSSAATCRGGEGGDGSRRAPGRARWRTRQRARHPASPWQHRTTPAAGPPGQGREVGSGRGIRREVPCAGSGSR